MVPGVSAPGIMFLGQLPWWRRDDSLFVGGRESGNSHASHTCGLISCNRCLQNESFIKPNFLINILHIFYCGYKIKPGAEMKETNRVGMSELH